MIDALVNDDEEQLNLFGEDPTVQLKRRRNMLARAVRSKNTREAQELDWKNYTAWCAKKNVEPLPATPDALEQYVIDELDRGNKVATLKRRLSTISVYHRDNKIPAPEKSDRLWNILANTQIERQEQPGAKEALSPDELREISEVLGSDVESIRDRAIMVFGFASAMRRSELSALDLADVKMVDRGVSVRIKRSKRDQGGKGKTIHIFPGARLASCPVRTLAAWLKARGDWPGPLFVRMKKGSKRETKPIVRHRLGPIGIIEIVKRSVALIGLDPKKYGAHSLRSGMVTAALDDDVNLPAIMERTGHKKPEMVARYYRPKPFSFDPLAKAM